jgi:hypothetical protein
MQRRLFFSYNLSPLTDLSATSSNNYEFRTSSVYSAPQCKKFNKVIFVDPREQVVKKINRDTPQSSICPEVVHWLISKYGNFLPTIQLIGFSVSSFLRQIGVENSLSKHPYNIPLEFWYSPNWFYPTHHIDLGYLLLGFKSFDSNHEKDIYSHPESVDCLMDLVYLHLKNNNQNIPERWEKFLDDPEVGLVVTLHIASQFNLI